MTYASPPSGRPLLTGRSHMAVAGHPLAAAAAMRLLEAGGNAIDAGVAAGFALNVLQPDMANLGGVAPILIHLAGSRQVTSYSGVGRWPMAATRALVEAAGGGRIPASPARWIVPAAVDAWLTVLARYGTMQAAEVMAPAIDLAERGFPLHYFLRANLAAIAARPDLSYAASIFLDGGAIPAEGTMVRQPDLASILRRLVEAERQAGGARAAAVMAARDAFYIGDIAEAIGRFAGDAGSFLRAEDLAAFHGKEEPPLQITYRGVTVFSCGPWCQGPALLQALRLLEGFDVASLGPVERAHIEIECIKHGLRARNQYYGDPDRVDVPMQWLLSQDYANVARRSIQLGAISSSDPVYPGERAPDTTYVCTADRAGNLFSATPSDSTMLMSPMVPGFGFGLSDRGLQASLNRDDPNVVEPGRRPRLTPNPGLLHGPDFTMAYGSPGGEVQTQAMLQVLVNHLDLGMDLQQAVEAPRWATTAVPATEDPHPAEMNRLYVEARSDPALSTGLARYGHDVRAWPPLAALAGGVCAIRRDDRTGVLSGGADPRRMSYGYAW